MLSQSTLRVLVPSQLVTQGGVGSMTGLHTQIPTRNDVPVESPSGGVSVREGDLDISVLRTGVLFSFELLL